MEKMYKCTKKTCAWMFIATLFIVLKPKKKIMSRIEYIHEIAYFSEKKWTIAAQNIDAC